ncbi:DUF2752 domain-containing protein [Streptomyces tubbatahanensis]|uniref:DUF2752 domain-containing protein n=1 Tax=Streptomyces tubbatahanensis TaxID=2923272 RepID=A0ABY3XUS9_9ACTN|nr:DUF2752 domain-containing protein [Streptomyces tubbatahanensis]UNS98175.1 DUF2752 domain-containing protein [Streptomyces tubbatahanensis]
MANTNVPDAVGRLRTVLSHPAAPPLVTAAAGLAGACCLWGVDPHEPGSWLPRCPLNWATGLLCPTCGATRMAYDLLHGDIIAALHDNAALLTVGLPAAAFFYGRWLYEGFRNRRYRIRLSTPMKVAAVAFAVAWEVARNLL